MNYHDKNFSAIYLFSTAFFAFLLFSFFCTPIQKAWSGEEHACDYLSAKEVSTTLGVTVGEITAQPANPLGQSICYFDIPAGMSLKFAQLQMVREGWKNHAKNTFTVKSLFENNMTFLETKKEISGVGDQAYWGGSGIKLGSGLHILYKDTYFSVLAKTGDDAENLAQSKKLATLIIAKLK